MSGDRDIENMSVANDTGTAPVKGEYLAGQVDVAKHAEARKEGIINTVEEQNCEQTQPGKWKFMIVMISLWLGTFLVALDATIIGVALPEITTQFSSLEDIAWYGSAYLLTGTALQPSFGNFYKFFDVKTTYLISIIIFEVGSILCAVAQNSDVFIVGRAISGVGCAGLFQGALSIIGRTVALEKRPIYISVVASVFGLSVCIGPIIGGAFVDHATWRWCFWINLPIGCFALVSIIAFLRLKASNDEYSSMSVKEKLLRMDLLGTVLFIGSITCMLFALQWGGQSLPWKSSKVIGLLVGFVVLMILFWWIQLTRGDQAIIPLRILKKRSIVMGSLFLFFMSMPNYAYTFYIPIYFQSIQGVSATASGVRFIAMMVPETIFTIISGVAVALWGYYVPYMVGGAAIAMIGFGLGTTIGINTSTAAWASYLVVSGIGMGVGMNVPYSALQAVVEDSDVATANAITVFSQQLGGAIALSICQNLFIGKLLAEIPRHTSDISPKIVVSAGASNLGRLTDSREVLNAIKLSYSTALQSVLYFSLAVTCCAFVAALGMERLNIKTVAKERKAMV